MKPAPFRYERPASAEQALALLAEHGEDCKLLAGGQSLVPMLNFRLARPAVLIDIGAIAELDYIRKREGRLLIGAVTKQSSAEHSRMIASGWPILIEAVHWVAHPQVRNMGTIGGSVAHADPAAELPVACAALDAKLEVRSAARGARTIAAEEFFVTHLTTVLEPDELLTEIEIPPLAPDTGWGFVEFARRHGDFALGGAAALLRQAEDGTCEQAVLTLMTAAPTPLRASAAEQALQGSKLDDEALVEAAKLAVADLSPTGDIHGSSEYRKSLAETMALRALRDALARSRPGDGAAG